MATKKSTRNKTINTTVEDGMEFRRRCVTSVEEIRRDCTIFGETLEFAPHISEGTADLIIADPPYNRTKNYNGRAFNKVSDDAYEAYTREWLGAIEHILKPTGSIYVCCDWECSRIIAGVLSEFFIIRNRITWQREKGRGAVSNWKNGMEDIWFATKSDEYTFNLDAIKVRRRVLAPYKEKGLPKDWEETEKGRFRDTCPSNFWDDITVPFWSMAENTAHPTQKPEKLIAKLILASSNKGELVFDPFLGSGTTSVTAKKLGRHYLGIERDPRFCIWAEQRLEMADTDCRIQGFSDGVFWERNAQKNY